MAQIAVAKAVNNCFELLSFTPYLPDFFLFFELKSHQRAYHFGNNDEIIYAVEEFLKNKYITFFYNTISMLEHQ